MGSSRARAQTAAPCTTPTTPCERWIALGGTARSLVYASYPLDKPNPAVTRALIMVQSSTGFLLRVEHIEDGREIEGRLGGDGHPTMIRGATYRRMIGRLLLEPLSFAPPRRP